MTKTLFTLRYHWKPVLLWGFGTILAVACWLMSERANAWVQGFQPFPDGDAQVIVQRFCRSQFCGYPSQGEWQRLIRSVMDEWNTASPAFTFREGTDRTGDPCRQPDRVTVILADPDQLCRNDGPLRRGARTEFQSYGGRTEWQARIYINAGSESAQDPASLRRLLLHEFGHAAGLGHPDDAGQRVQAVMNSVIYHNHLQPDDIAGIRALYSPQGGTEGDPLTGALENPSPGARMSGVSLVSGWVCEAEKLEVSFNGGPRVFVPSGSERADTRDMCGDADNGFGLLINYNILGDGSHTVTLYADGVLVDQSQFTVKTLGTEFLRGREVRDVVENFPRLGESAVIHWDESLQNFVITDVLIDGRSNPPPVIIDPGDQPGRQPGETEAECIARTRARGIYIRGACGEDG